MKNTEKRKPGRPTKKPHELRTQINVNVQRMYIDMVGGPDKAKKIAEMAIIITANQLPK